MTVIHQLLADGNIYVGFPGATKEDVLNGLLSRLEGHPAVHDLERVRESVLSREQMMSTGVGKELALPHAKTSAVSEPVAVFAVTERSIPFGSIDNQPVRLLFLLVGPEGARSEHIKVLSRVSRLMNRDAFRAQLLKAKDADEVLRLFEQTEAELLEQ